MSDVMNTFVEDVPDFDDLIPVAEAARRLKLSVGTIHRWRMHPETPLRCWRMGRDWQTTEAELRDYVRRRTAASTRGGDDAPAAPPYSPRRRKEIAAAVAECERLGC